MLYNDGFGSMTNYGGQPYNLQFDYDVWDSAVGDIDADGDLDVVFGNGFLAMQIWRNEANCNGDLDNDGIPDFCDVDHAGGEDCNLNGILDSCDLANGVADLDGNGVIDECDPLPFRRGDANGDGAFNVADAISTIDYLFLGGELPCADSGDANDDGQINIADPVNLLGVLFTGGAPPPEPGPDACGLDPTPTNLDCEIYNAC